MSKKKTINFKDPSDIHLWLRFALKKEKEKYEKCPVKPDLMPDYEATQWWGYVVTGYFLMEQAFKGLLHVREKEVHKKHSLHPHFESFQEEDRAVLREYYNDYRDSIGASKELFPFSSLDDFLINLDGDKNTGSLDWRYFPVEEKRSQRMPLVSVEFLHEIIFGCIQIIKSVNNAKLNPYQSTYGWRMRRDRYEKKYRHWLTVRMNSDGWGNFEDRLEILHGPDHLGRHDLILYRGEKQKWCFSKIPDDLELPIVDKREEIQNFDPDEGYRSIGVTFFSPSNDQGYTEEG